MKQLFTFLFAVWWLPLTLQAQFIYTTNSGAITITGYTGADGTVTIPNTINGYPVTSLADDAFWYNSNLTNLIVGTNVLNIGANTFAFSTNLASVIIPNSVTNLGGGAFQNCTNLLNISLGESVLTVGGSAFAFDASLVGLYFQGNAPAFVSLTSVFYAVHGATIYYNAGATGWAASYDALSTQTIQSQYTYTTNAGVITITGYTGTNAAMLAIPAAITGLPVASIGVQAFLVKNFTGVNIPDSVITIGYRAFVGCPMTNIILPNSVISIADNAFLNCRLTSVVIPASVASIGVAPFAFNTGLSALTVVPQNPNYSSVGGVLFDKNQTTLIEYPGGLAGAYVIPVSVTNVAEEAFYGCSGLTSLTLLSSLTSIESYAFVDCVNLSAITVDPQNKFFSSVNGVLFNNNQTVLIAFPGGFVGTYAIPDGITTIGDNLFSSVYGLTGVTIPNSVTNIGYETFDSDVSLTSITIPSSVTNLEYGAFLYCSDLTNILFQGNAPALGQLVFYDLPSSAKAYYLAGTAGWSATYGGLPTVELFVPTLRNVSVTGNFGFAITGVTNETVVVEGSTNLMNWQPLQTNSAPPFQFSDTHWTSYPHRFYRVRYAP